MFDNTQSFAEIYADPTLTFSYKGVGFPISALRVLKRHGDSGARLLLLPSLHPRERGNGQAISMRSTQDNIVNLLVLTEENWRVVAKITSRTVKKLRLEDIARRQPE
ncbi:hypothetical protein J6590_070946 [Homalodisca vitripennis]|nr:hypothetical protein J6590_070946 [Homalodisca vitripennis]